MTVERWERLIGLAVACTVIAFFIYLVINPPVFSQETLAIIRFLAAAAAALSAYLFIGKLDIQGQVGRLRIRALGAFAVFIAVFFLFLYGIPDDTLNPSSDEAEKASQRINLIVNSGFEEAESLAWSSEGKESFISNSAYSGSYAVCTTQSLSHGRWKWVGIKQSISVNGGQQYKVGAWMKWQNATQVHLKVLWKNISEESVAPPDSQHDASHIMTAIDGSSQGWERISGEVQSPPEAVEGILYITHGVEDNKDVIPGGTLCVDDAEFYPI